MVVISCIDLDNLSHENKEFVKKEAVGVVKHTLELNYDYWSVGNCQAWFYSRNVYKVVRITCVRSFLILR